MYDTSVTIVGNALNAPELRRTSGANTLVASFRIASTSRRYDKDNARWVDGPSLRVRVTCWRRLAEGVTQSVVTGDPLVVTGRMYTRDWIGDDGQHRVSYELEAVAVGHDLSRGFARFARHRPAAVTSAVEDNEAEARIAGEVSKPIATGAGSGGDLAAPAGAPGGFAPMTIAEPFGDFDGGDRSDSVEEDAMDVLRAAGLAGHDPEAGIHDGPVADLAGRDPEADLGDPRPGSPSDGVADTVGEGHGQTRAAGGRRGRARTPEPV